MPKSEIRLQKYLAQCGLASRRKAEALIVAGKIAVNGKVVAELGTKIDPAKDRVTFDGRAVNQEEEKVYLKLYKPRGIVSSCRHFEEKTILDLVKDVPFRLYPIGRLDIDSEGLILLTNDGELANRLMHPRYEHEKEYLVNVKYPMTNDQLMNLKSGIIIDGKKTLPAKVTLLHPTTISLTLREGRKRQIRKMVEAVGNRVVNLKRLRIQNITLGNLQPGEYQYLSPKEIASFS